MTVAVHDDDQPPRGPERRTRNRLLAVSVAIAAVAATAIIVATTATAPAERVPAVAAASTSTAEPAETGAPTVPAISADELAALPQAVYNAVIPGLLPYSGIDASAITHSYTAQSDVPLYGDDRGVAVAKIPARNFLDEPTVIVPVKVTGDWAFVLTPSRQATPSSVGGNAPAQTAGWVPLASLTQNQVLDSTVTISASAQTLTIVGAGGATEFAIGVGSDQTPTPTGTTGYLQARYDDPTQADYTIQLTSLHSSAADEPFGGTDGGLIGIHYNTTNTGEVSHGCIRLTYAALSAVNALPLGTPIVITD
ncbi:L,D-transpeptidase family protein [Conyzicola sp.]|uniref:L,D-transpeptidase family protein n=1 Tax=Conyzicola sp. TaxID=1969404 RepID=UPI00398A47E8